MTTYGTVLFQSTLPAWGATSASWSGGIRLRFQSTLPAWGATPTEMSSAQGEVSIHAPAWGATSLGSHCSAIPICFNPRSPRGPTRSPLKLEAFMLFQSTLPAWGATLPQMSWANRLAVSIHAPRVGSDRSASRRFPCSRSVSIHAPRGERPFSTSAIAAVSEFQSTLPRGERQQKIQKCAPSSEFQCTLPRGERRSGGG